LHGPERPKGDRRKNNPCKSRADPAPNGVRETARVR
jgi:hypothetical protein